MSEYSGYPDVTLTEDSVQFDLGGKMVSIESHWVDGTPKIVSQRGYFNRITLSVFVDSIHIDGGVQFGVEDRGE